MNFCRRCGSKLGQKHDHIFVCERGHTIYANCSPSVGILLLTENGKLLLSRRGIEPRKGMFDTVGGFVDGEETLESAVEREIEEELGLKPSDYSRPAFLCSAIGHYPYENDALPVLSSFFQARLAAGAIPTAKDDVGELVQLDISEVDLAEMHDDDVRQAIIQLQKGVI